MQNVKKIKSGKKDEISCKNKIYYEENKEQIAEHKKYYDKENSKKSSDYNTKYYDKEKGNLNKQLILFRNKCFGPIYTCICCIRDLFKRSDEELKGDLKRKILDEKNMHSMLTFDESLIIKDEYQESSEQKKDSK